jgi:Flp pilus assembly protein TadD
LGLINLRQGDLDSALANVERSCELVNHANSLFLNSLAQVLMKRDEWERARDVVRQAVTLRIDRPEVRQSLQHKLRLLSQPAGVQD